MSEINHAMNERLIKGLGTYSLVEIVHHIVGNELAIISGYTQLSLREAVKQGKASASLDLEKLAQRDEKRLSYLRIMKASEERLNDFLFQLRDSLLVLVESSFNAYPVKTDLVLFFKQTIENLKPLYNERDVYIQLPVQPVYVLCDHLWMILALEHIFLHTVAAHVASVPVIIEIDDYYDSSKDLHTARMRICITREARKRTAEAEEIFGLWSRTLDERDQDLCTALCMAIIREHGGDLRIEQEAEQREVVSVVLPLVK